MQRVALFFALRPKLYSVFFGSVPCQATNENMLVSAKPLLRQLILQLAGKNAGFLDLRIVRFRDVATQKCIGHSANVSPLRGRSRQFSSRGRSYTTRGNPPDRRVRLLRKHMRRAYLVSDQTAAFGKALLSGGISVLMNEILLRRLPFPAVVHVAKPSVENQRPLLFGGGVCGNNKGKQQASGDQGFHGAHSCCFEPDLRAAFRQYNLG